MKKCNALCILLCILLLSSVICVSADEPIAHEITIATPQQFLQFAEDCRLDSYSQNLTVKLTADIDLTGQSFSGIPIFYGKLNGNGHTVSGINLHISGSNGGLFRYLTESAVVSDLNIFATVTPKSSGSYIGGIAGQNAGVIRNCTFSGTVSGSDHIGGIAGTNTHTGQIDNCTAEGIVYGNHFAGGIAGSNSGIIKGCKNSSRINTELKQNEVDLSDITLDALTGTESAATVTDIGGIAGINSGFISDCQNTATIGYPHIGYNIGGIAGSQTGYISDCSNTGIIHGRKEVGGIVGQLEPVLAVTYAEDTLQILQEQMNTLSSQVNNTAESLTNTAAGVKQQFTLIQGQLQSSVDTMKDLFPGDDTEPILPTPEEFSQAIDTLQNTITSIKGSMQNIYDEMENADSALEQNMQRISATIATMQNTLNNASEHLGGSVSDHSDSDSENTLTAKIERCRNTGTVNADRNGGGIAGAIAFENDFDPEDDIELSGNMTLNFTGAYRAVITLCENDAQITVKKQNAGGIVGYGTMGLIRFCSNTANLYCPDASYVGGIAGKSEGLIRGCNAKSIITADKIAGGIAGHAATVSDCLAMSQVSASEKTGMLLGSADDLSLITNNFYMQISADLGAIDGISYDAAAKGISVSDFLKIKELPDFFQSYCVTFVFPDQSTQEITLKTGETLDYNSLPQLPVLDGCKGSWNNLDDIGFFDVTIDSTYETKLQVVQSQHLRDSGLPVLLAEGSFLPGFQLEAAVLQDSLAPNAIDGWTFINTGIATLRYLPPENISAGDLCVMLKDGSGNWKQVPHTINGSYLVFQTDGQSNAFCVVSVQSAPWGLYILSGCVFLVIAGIVMIVVIKRKNRPKQAAESTAAT